MKIAVLMWYDGEFESYGDNCYKINKVYCDKYGYDLIKSSERVYDSVSLPFRKAHWERYPLILKHIKNYDYVVWIDADAFFYNISPPIIDLINKYKKQNKIKADYIGRGGVWMDTGSIQDFYNTSNFVSTIENRQGFKIACLEEISFNNKWIKKKEILNSIKFYGNCAYSQYLKKLIKW